MSLQITLVPAALEPVLQRVFASSPSPILRNAVSVLSHLSATITNVPVMSVWVGKRDRCK